MSDDTVEAMSDVPSGTWRKRGVSTMDGLPAASAPPAWPTRGLWSCLLALPNVSGLIPGPDQEPLPSCCPPATSSPGIGPST